MIDRRNFLVKAAAMAGVATLRPWELLSGPPNAHAFPQTVNEGQKIIFNGLLHSNLPDMYALYGMPYIPNINRNTGGVGNWPDPTDVPNEAWYDVAAAATISAAVSGWAFLDHEQFPTNAFDHVTNQASAAKFVTVLTKLRQRTPGIKWGNYVYPVWRNFDIPLNYPIGHSTYNVWVGLNDDWAAMYPHIDALFPSCYIIDCINRQVGGSYTCSGVRRYLERNIEIGRVMARKYGNPDLKVYPFIWWKYATPTKAVSNCVNNGSGLIRVTTTTAHQFLTGNTVQIFGVNGTTEANNTWTVTRIDSTTIDLLGSTFVNAYTNGGTALFSPQEQDNDQDIWEETFRTCMQKADGCILWGGYGADFTTDSLKGWFQFIKPHLEQHRFWATYKPSGG